METVQEKTAYAKWYASNKKAFNAKRRAKYKASPELRKAALERSTEYRKTLPNREPVQHHHRQVNGELVEVYRIGTASKLAECSIQAIRSWSRQGILPRATIRGSHRYYTMAQIMLIKELADTLRRLRNKGVVRQKGIEDMRVIISENWES